MPSPHNNRCRVRRILSAVRRITWLLTTVTLVTPIRVNPKRREGRVGLYDHTHCQQQPRTPCSRSLCRGRAPTSRGTDEPQRPWGRANPRPHSRPRTRPKTTLGHPEPRQFHTCLDGPLLPGQQGHSASAAAAAQPSPSPQLPRRRLKGPSLSAERTSARWTPSTGRRGCDTAGPTVGDSQCVGHVSSAGEAETRAGRCGCGLCALPRALAGQGPGLGRGLGGAHRQVSDFPPPPPNQECRGGDHALQGIAVVVTCPTALRGVPSPPFLPSPQFPGAPNHGANGSWFEADTTPVHAPTRGLATQHALSPEQQPDPQEKRPKPPRGSVTRDVNNHTQQRVPGCVHGQGREKGGLSCPRGRADHSTCALGLLRPAVGTVHQQTGGGTGGGHVHLRAGGCGSPSRWRHHLHSVAHERPQTGNPTQVSSNSQMDENVPQTESRPPGASAAGAVA